uniref:AcidPPc domain-containing protein n=1 Tax=Syphacia muris TaxID=451379 RepID=A0A0N5ACU8_9BILA
MVFFFEVEVRLWLWDRYLSGLLAVESGLGANQGFRRYLLFLEWAVNGIPWLAASIISVLYVLRKDFSDEFCWYFEVLLVGLCLDLIFVGSTKVLVRRNRPTYNKPDQKFIIRVFDDFSFPSGDVSRATFLTLFGLYYCDFSWWVRSLLKALPVIVGISRVTMGRHYVSDVIGGLF